MAETGPASPGTPPEESPGAVGQITGEDMGERPPTRRVHKQLLVIDIDGATAPKHSLQDAFKKFRRKKQKEIKKAKKRKEIPEEVRLRAMSDADRMWRLRMKFLNQAKKYFGVPYAKKYWTPDDPEYGSPFFLDCCGLIRRCLKDLRKSFGFNIGPWNQAYQFDTLPITVEREEDMQPGDLVFISATYNNPKSKKQKHDMTHVEIWLGDGHKTIGARWQKGKVQVFDSYKFEAKAYHSERYIFKSIDTWLMGICRSHCPQHTWKTRAQKFKPSKKSIFVQKQGEDNSSSQRQQQQQEQSASPSDSDSLRLEEEIVADDMARLSMTTVNVGDLGVHQGRLLMKDEECYHSDIDHDIENALDCYDDDTCGVDDDDDDVDEIEQNGNNNNNNSTNEPDSTGSPSSASSSSFDQFL